MGFGIQGLDKHGDNGTSPQNISNTLIPALIVYLSIMVTCESISFEEEEYGIQNDIERLPLESFKFP